MYVMNKIGLHRPEGIGESSVEENYNEQTGMSFEIFLPLDRAEGDQRVIVAASHDDVGLVIWYDFPTYAEFWEWSGLNYGDLKVVGIDTDGCAIWEEYGERWNCGVNFLYNESV